MAIDPRALTKAKADKTYMKQFFNEQTITDSDGQWFFHFNLINDGTPEDTWPDRWMFSFGGKPVSWFNEYTELRLSPAKNSTIPFRIFSKIDPTDTDHNAGVSLFEIVYNRVNRSNIFRIDTEGDVESIGSATFAGPATFGGPIRRAVPTGPTLETGYLVLAGAAPVPANTPAGTLIFRTA